MAPAIAVCASLTKIWVGGNKLGDEGAIVLCDALHESKVTKVQELDMGHNEIGPAGAKAVASTAAAVASVTSVDLSDNEIGPAGAKALIDGGVFNASVTSVRNPAHPNRSSHVP